MFFNQYEIMFHKVYLIIFSRYISLNLFKNLEYKCLILILYIYKITALQYLNKNKNLYFTSKLYRNLM